MNIKLSHNLIKEKCGTVSFKRGDAFFRADKVTFKQYGSEGCEAIVSANEEFLVKVCADETGTLVTECSCPKLASYQKDCQHIAAVLLAVLNHLRQGTSPMEAVIVDTPEDVGLAKGLLTLFNHSTPRSMSRQTLLEKREVLKLVYRCKPVAVLDGHMLGIQLKIGGTSVGDIREFLKRVQKGHPYTVSPHFTYDPGEHCFSRETDAVLQELFRMVYDEKTYFEAYAHSSGPVMDKQVTIISPTSWLRLAPLLANAPFVELEHHGQLFSGLQHVSKLLPLQFAFYEDDVTGFWMEVNGLEETILLNPYSMVLHEGKLVQLKAEDSERLAELKKMLDRSGKNKISIPENQIQLFLEKVIPGLRKLGDVHISQSLTKKYLRTPLVAKLYLDRVNNRLLAGLEFHYENIVIQPLERRVFSPDALFIRDRVKEDSILQLMEESSFTKTDGGYYLQNEELEYEFLYHVLPRLQKVAQIYATTAIRNRVFKENPRPRIRIKAMKERTNWLEFKFNIDGIPEKQIREVLAALEEKRKYYRLRNGSLLSLETREFEKVQQFLSASGYAGELEKGLKVPLIQGLKMLETVEEHALTVDETFYEFLDGMKDPGSLKYEIPRQLESVMRDYQKTGFKWLKQLASYGFGGILADDMGLGKTLQSISFILSELSEIRKQKLPVLIVCPSSLTYNWLSELIKFAPDVQAAVIDGSKEERVKAQAQSGGFDVVITSYPLLRRDIKWYESQCFHTVFFDEAQAFKNPGTQTAKAVKKIRAENSFALTGTPVENAVEELWSIFHIVFPELFLDLKEYSQLTSKNIARRIRPFLLRRRKEEVLPDLPEKTASIESAELNPDQKKLYAAYLAKLRHDTLKHLDKETIRKNRIKILAGLTRLRQICCHPSLFVDDYRGKSAKFDQLMEIVEESRDSGRRLLIFSQFTKMLGIIGHELAYKGIDFFYLDGQTPSEERLRLTGRFNSGEREVFLISLKAGGTGLNLTGADTVILYDLWWNPAVEEQAADRAHRFGQQNPVQVIKLISAGTIEEKIHALQEKKRDMIGELIHSGDSLSSFLTDEDIRDIFTN
ncbi:DEAD/DEAH box helicase [Mesobacillus foraminis]|uniref:DEAD/DEAH box helicase n=1 Tax=Mesobacillus foraminis TaxID=279826 RepID=UPI0039A1E817